MYVTVVSLPVVSLAFALAVAGATLIVRSKAPLIWREQPPLSCNLCCSAWGSLFTWLFLGAILLLSGAAWYEVALLVLAAAGAVPIAARLLAYFDPLLKEVYNRQKEE